MRATVGNSRYTSPHHASAIAKILAGPFGLRGGSFEERQILRGERRALVVLLEFIDIHCRLGQEIGVGEPLRVSGGGDNGGCGWHV